MTPQTKKNQYLSIGILVSNAYRRFCVNHGFFCILGANMDPTWTHVGTQNPWKPEKNEFKRVSNKHCILGPVFMWFWYHLGRLLGPKLAPWTAQDGAQERPRRAQDGPRDAQDRVRSVLSWILVNFLETGAPGPPKTTPRTFQNRLKIAHKIVRDDLGSTPCRVHFFNVRFVQNHLVIVAPLRIRAGTDEEVNR